LSNRQPHGERGPEYVGSGIPTDNKKSIKKERDHLTSEVASLLVNEIISFAVR
jgi:hypothetical protein